MLLLWTSLIATGANQAQSAILDTYITQAIEQNLSIQNARLLSLKQANLVHQTKTQWRPRLDFSASYLLAEGGRIIVFPVGDLFNPTYQVLNQLTGTQGFPTDLENERIQLTPRNFLDAQLQLTKPLINPAIKYGQAIQNILFDIKNQEVLLTKNEIIYQVKKAYFNYLKTIESQRILQFNINLLEQILAFNQKLVKYDKATMDIVSDVKYQIENIKSQMIQLNEQEVLSQALFNLYLNRDINATITIDKNILDRIDWVTPSIDEILARALQNRPELMNLASAHQINTLNHKKIKKENLPTVNLFGGIGLQTENFNFDEGGPLYTAGIAMNINILDGGLRRQKLEELQIDKEILSNQERELSKQVEIEILQEILALQSIKSRLESQGVAIESAQKSYDIIYSRYKNGKALLIEVLQAQNKIVEAQLSQSISKYDFLSRQAALDKVESTRDYE